MLSTNLTIALVSTFFHQTRSPNLNNGLEHKTTVELVGRVCSMKDAQSIPPALISHMGHGTVADHGQADLHEVSYLSEQLQAFSPNISNPPLPPSLTYHLNGCKAKESLGPIWDHVKLLYIERLTASFIFFLSLV